MSAEHDDDLWFVELPDGRTRCMSLEELDEAYQKGEIDESVRVRKDGEAAWSTLAKIAGLDADAFAATIPSAPPPSYGPSSLSPYAIAVAPSTPPPALAATPTPGPTALGLDDDDVPYEAMQKSSKPLLLGLVGTTALAAAIAVFFVTRAGGTGEIVKALPAAAAAQAAPPPAAVDPAPPPQAAAPAPAAKLSDDQRKALAALDKKHETEAQKKAKERAEKAASQQVRRTRGKSSEPFVKGTSKYDPLNGTL